MAITLNVTAQTSLQDLQNFSEQAGAQAKIRGQNNADGSITLYASEKKSGLWSLITGSRNDKQQAARAGIERILGNMERGMPGLALAQTRTVMSSSLHTELRGNALQLLTSMATGNVQREAAKLPTQEGPSLTDMSATLRDSDAVKTLGAKLQAHEQAGTPTLALASELAREFAKDLSSHATPQTVENFALSNGVRFQNDLKALILKQFEGAPAGDAPPLDTHELNAFAKDVYNQMAAQLLPDRQLDDGSIRLKGTTYTLDRVLGAGGYGNVSLYKSADDPPRMVAVKLMNDPGKGVEEMASEFRAHRSAAGASGHANVVGLEGLFRGADGSMGLALELAPHKDVDHMGTQLDKAVKSGDLSAPQAKAIRLTLLQDMLKGLQHVQENQGLIHMDLKPANFLVGQGGVAKMADFGTSKVTDSYVLSSGPGVDEARWQAPEIIHIKLSKEAAIDRAMVIKPGEIIAAIKKDLLKVEGADAAKLHKLAQNVYSHVSVGMKTIEVDKSGVNAMSVTAKSDTWALGITAFNLFFGNEHPFDDKDDSPGYQTRVMQNIQAYKDDPDSHLIGDKGKKDTTGDPKVDRFINQLCHSDPLQRPDLKNLESHEIFSGNLGVGSHAVRQAIQALASDDLAQVRLLAAEIPVG